MNHDDNLEIRDSIDEQLKQVRQFYALQMHREIKQRKNGFIREVLAWVTAASAIGLLYYMLPLKQTQPVLAIVDGAHGIVQEVQYLEPGSKITNNEALIKSYAYSYVTGRYGYAFMGSSENLRDRYLRVMAFTGDSLMANLKQEIASDNPSSPYLLYGEKGTINVQIDSINIFSGDRVQINFQTIASNGDNNRKVFAYTALGKFEWSKFDGMSQKNRYVNPFGFKFTEWSVTQNLSNSSMSSSAQLNGTQNNSQEQPQNLETQVQIPTQTAPAPIPPLTTQPQGQK